MVAGRLTRIVLILLLIVLFVVLAAGPAAAAPVMQTVPEAGSGLMGPPLQAGCGDGICDAYMGENASTCPQDCTFTLVPVVSPGATATRVIVTRAPTVGATVSTTTAPTTAETSPTPAYTPQERLRPTPTLSGGSASQPGCDLAAYESRAQAWQKGYGGKASPQSFIPSRTDNREIYVCTVQPVGDVCIPIYQGLIKASDENIENIVLVDCSTDGSCQIHGGPARQVEESICFSVTQADGLSCSAGCALAPRQTDVLVLPLFGNIPFRILAPTACLTALLIIGVVLGIIFVTRRSRRPELPSASVSQSPSGWDTIPRSDERS